MVHRLLRVWLGGAAAADVTGAVCFQLCTDELLFEVDAADAVLGPDGDVQHPGQRFLQVAAAVKRTMEGAAAMTVPLRVKMAWGCSWGSLEDLEL